MAFIAQRRINVLQLIVATISFLAVTRTESGGVTYRGFNNYNRWSDAVTRCKQSDHGGGFLTKIKNLDELKKARVAASIQHHTVDFWVGVKYDKAKDNFIGVTDLLSLVLQILTRL
ncbi:hypothetical protein OS493_034276 [Desmophyllum pertusum]|uniref:Uncharacterized protein n=1 Tax=Desmophyllum pertusum TaxID=174260 RepID=A0A9W9YV58_9CNID|nr:hypothetical protein OS493_034276 [Desmophyllum pertusum]